MLTGGLCWLRGAGSLQTQYQLIGCVRYYCCKGYFYHLVVFVLAVRVRVLYEYDSVLTVSSSRSLRPPFCFCLRVCVSVLLLLHVRFLKSSSSQCSEFESHLTQLKQHISKRKTSAEFKENLNEVLRLLDGRTCWSRPRGFSLIRSELRSCVWIRVAGLSSLITWCPIITTRQKRVCVLRRGGECEL